MTAVMPFQGLEYDDRLMLTDRNGEVNRAKMPSGASAWNNDKASRVLALVISRNSQKRISIEVRSGSLPFPAWLTPTIHEIAKLVALPAGWDRMGAPTIANSAISMALAAMQTFMSDASSVAQWTPTRDGGVQLDWHENGIDLEIEFDPNKADGYAVFSDHADTSQDWDGSISANIERLKSLFSERLNARPKK